MTFKKFKNALITLILVLVCLSPIQAQVYDLSALTTTSSPLSITGLRGTGSNIGAWAKIVNHSNIAQNLRHNRGTGVAAASGGQGYGKASVKTTTDYTFMQGFRPWYIKPNYDYVIPPNATVEIPLYVLCQNLYADPMADNLISDFGFFAIRDSVMQVYTGIDRMNVFLMDSLRTNFWIQEESYVYYPGTLSQSDHALIQTGYWVADSTNYMDTDWGRYYAVDSLYLNPGIVNWAIWAVTDNADSTIMKKKINEWRGYAGHSPLPDDIIRTAFCPVYAALKAAKFHDIAKRFYQSWYDPSLQVNEKSGQLPNEFLLGQNYPNPFNNCTMIEFEMPRSGNVRLEIFDLLGRKIMTLVDDYKNKGLHKIIWDAKYLPSGTYIYRLSHENGIIIKKSVLLR